MGRYLLVVVVLSSACSMASPASPTLIGVSGSHGAEAPVDVVVPGTRSPWLARAAEGTRANGFTPGSVGVDVAPDNSPIAVTLPPGLYAYDVEGCVRNHPELPCHDANGGEVVSHYAGAENGIANLAAPLNGLIGLRPDSTQPFFLGKSGCVAVSSLLYLGTMDGWEWHNNVGEFRVRFTVIDEPRAGCK